MVGSFTASLFYWGPGNDPNLHYAMDYVGYALGHFLPLASVASFGGVHLLSGLAAVIVCLLYLGWQRPHLRGYVGSALVVITLMVTIAYFGRSTDTDLDRSIISIDTAFTNELLADSVGHTRKRDQVREAIIAALGYQPDYVLLPEDSRLTSTFGSPEETMDFLSAHGTSTIVVESSRTTSHSGNVVQRAYIYNLGTNQIYLVDKEFSTGRRVCTVPGQPNSLPLSSERQPVIYKPPVSLSPGIKCTHAHHSTHDSKYHFLFRISFAIYHCQTTI